MTRRSFITTAIPFVNAAPHLGFALELVQADVIARHHRSRGWSVRFQSGTDDNSLKNVRAAEVAGVGVHELVDGNADAFAALRTPLALSFDDFVRTSRDPRHRPTVESLWRACAASDDLYRRDYDGWYCVGCEEFLTPGGPHRERRLSRTRGAARAVPRGELVLPAVAVRGRAPRSDRQRPDPISSPRAGATRRWPSSPPGSTTSRCPAR